MLRLDGAGNGDSPGTTWRLATVLLGCACLGLLAQATNVVDRKVN